jgi:hypothetical protein
MNVQNNTVTPVHGLWIGDELSRIELLTLLSFIHHGHEFHLWTYDTPRNFPGEGVVLRDAREIIEKENVFQRRFKATGLKIGCGSFALFSDLFRFKVLLEHGGWWVDMDMTCLRHLCFTEEYIFRYHDQLPIMGNIMKCPKGSPVMEDSYSEAALEVNSETLDWFAAQRILARNVQARELLHFRRRLCNQDIWEDILRYVQGDLPMHPEWHAFHWCNEQWRIKGLNKNKPPTGGSLEKLMLLHGV